MISYALIPSQPLNLGLPFASTVRGLFRGGSEPEGPGLSLFIMFIRELLATVTVDIVLPPNLMLVVPRFAAPIIAVLVQFKGVSFAFFKLTHRELTAGSNGVKHGNSRGKGGRIR